MILHKESIHIKPNTTALRFTWCRMLRGQSVPSVGGSWDEKRNQIPSYLLN